MIMPVANFELSLKGHVSAGPGRVWSHLLDQEAIPCWLEGVSAVAADGDRFLVRAGQDDSRDWISGEVLEADPRRRLELRLEDPAPNVREARIALTLSPDEAGTFFELVVVGVPSLLGGLMLPWLRLRSEVAMARAVRGFRAALEVRKDSKGGVADGPCPERAEPRVAAGRLAATATF